MKIINEFLPRLKEKYASDEKREYAKAVKDTDAEKARRRALQDLIDKIDAMDDVLGALPAWTASF